MLRVASRSSAAARANLQAPRRLAHGVSYGPEEPLGYYVKWIAAVGGFTGLLAYDRFYSDRQISKWLTPATDVEAIERQREQFADRQIQEQDRNIEFLYPRERTTHLTTFSAHPVPVGAHRASYSNDVVEQSAIGERRPRAN